MSDTSGYYQRLLVVLLQVRGGGRAQPDKDMRSRAGPGLRQSGHLKSFPSFLVLA